MLGHLSLLLFSLTTASLVVWLLLATGRRDLAIASRALTNLSLGLGAVILGAMLLATWRDRPRGAVQWGPVLLIGLMLACVVLALVGANMLVSQEAAAYAAANGAVVASVPAAWAVTVTAVAHVALIVVFGFGSVAASNNKQATLRSIVSSMSGKPGRSDRSGGPGDRSYGRKSSSSSDGYGSL